MSEAGAGFADDAPARRFGSRTVMARLRPAALLAAFEAEQERWFLWVPVFLGAGIAAYFQLAAEPPLLLAIAPLPVALVLSLLWRRGSPAVMVGGALLAAATGFALAKIRTDFVRAPVLERQYWSADVRGFVELVEPRASRGQRITLRLVSFAGVAPERMPYRIRVRTMTALPGLKPGDGLRLKATLAAPGIPALPGDYDFARAAWFMRLGGIGYSMARPTLDPDLGEPPFSLRFWAGVERVRLAIGQRITSGLAGEPGQIANGLITGERGGISQATNDAYRDSGLFHILSISGLHMVIMAGAVFWVARVLLALVPWIALRLPIKKIAALAATIAALGYLLISGASPATVRSWITISMMFFAVLMDRPALSLRNVALSALAILVVFPENLFDVGFQMSYAAVVALVAVYEWLREREAANGPAEPRHALVTGLLFFGGIILTTLIASAAVAPLAAYYFHKSQQYAVLANLIAIPVCNILVMPAALATLIAMPFGLEAVPLWLMGHGIDLMTWIAYTVARLPGAVGRIAAIPTLAFGLMAVGGLWLCLFRTRLRLAGLALVTAGLGFAPMRDKPDILVGRDGALVAVRTPQDQLSATPAKGAKFELTRWLEHEADARAPRQVSAADAFRCDGAGCTVTVKGQLVAVATHPAALADDCARANILVLTFPRPPGCGGTGGLVIDFFRSRAEGTITVFIDDGQVRVKSVASARGDRPWAPSRDVRRPLMRKAALAAGSRLSAFAAPVDLAGGDGRRPEHEDDDLQMDDRGP
jgi:competence protein ComEC